MNKNVIFKAIAWFGGIYHTILGLLGIFAPMSIIEPLVRSVYGVNATVDLQFEYMVKFLAAYFIAFGVMMMLLGFKPEKYRALLIPAILLFVIRIFSRLYFFDLLSETFGVTMLRNMQTVIPVSIMVIGMLIFRPQKSK